MTKGSCFNHLTKRSDDKSEKWQKSWDFLPESFLLSEEVLEQLKLVDAMEEDVAFKESSSLNLMTAKNKKETELNKIGLRYERLTTECQEMEKLMDALNQKKQSRAKKLGTIEKKQIQTKEQGDQEREKVDIYSKRIREYLGLSLTETTTNSTVLVFNNIDECATDRKSLCEYTLEGPNATVYKVLRCEPMLEDLREMVDKLNATNDLSGFVTNLRTKFQQHVFNDI